MKSDFEAAIHRDNVNASSVEGNANGCKSSERRRVTVQEIEDESCLEARLKPKSSKHLLYNVDEEAEQEKPSVVKHPTRRSSDQSSTPDRFNDRRTSVEETHSDPSFSPRDQAAAFATEAAPLAQEDSSSVGIESIESFQLPPPPKEIKPIRMPKKRFCPSGESSVGVSVLSVKGWVGNLDNPLTDLRLDSCADVTLISSEYHDRLKASPPVQQGMRMRLWQLTDTDSKLKGFVRIPIFMMTADGVIIESEAEAYVVPGMTVPILLGEDYQLTYEVGVTRNVEEGPRVHFGKSEYEIVARQVDQTKDFDRMRQSAYSVGRFIRNKLHCRRKNKQHRQKMKFGLEEKVVRAKEDCRLRPHECKSIQVEGQLGEDRDWLVTKNLLSGADDSYFAIPNTLISANNPWVPVSNPSDRPRFIRKGEIIGVLSDPEEYFDHVKTMADWEARTKHADAIAAIIQIQINEDRKANEQKDDKPAEEGSAQPQEDEAFGPKTAEMPDMTEYPSSKMKDFIDVMSPYEFTSKTDSLSTEDLGKIFID